MPRAERGFEILEHTADLGLRVWASNLDDLFAEGAFALVAVMGSSSRRPTLSERVEIEGPDLDALFVDWLAEVLFLFDARSVVPSRIDIHVGQGPCVLRATVEGCDAAGFAQHGPAVKAVTYHLASVSQTAHGFEARVYLDV